MVRVSAHLEEGPLDATQDLLVNPVVRHLGHPPGALLPNAVPDQLFVLSHQTGEPMDDAVEQLLMPVIHRQQCQSLGQDRRDGYAPEWLDDAAVDQRMYVL